MKKGIHPETHNVTAHCTCGFSFNTHSTVDDIHTTICSHCHPFYTGAQKFVDTAGRIEKFEQRYKGFNKAAKPAAAKPAKAEKAPKAKTK